MRYIYISRAHTIRPNLGLETETRVKKEDIYMNQLSLDVGADERILLRVEGDVEDSGPFVENSGKVVSLGEKGSDSVTQIESAPTRKGPLSETRKAVSAKFFR